MGALQSNIYKLGELTIGDVITPPAIKRAVKSYARCSDAAHDPDLAKAKNYLIFNAWNFNL